MKASRLVSRLSVAALILAAALTAQGRKSLADLYKTGSVRFVPEITITDEAMGGKEFFSAPGDITVGEDGRVYVCDYKSNHIKVFDAAGRFRGTIGKAGQGPGDFNYPMEIEFASGQLYVRELMNMRLSVFDPDGKFVRSIPVDPGGGSWQKIRALPDGRLVVEKKKIDRGSPDAPQLVFLDLYSRDLAFIRRLYEHEVWQDKYVLEPRSTNVPVPFPAIVHWGVARDGRLAIGYSSKYEIEILDPDKGRAPLIARDHAPVEVTEADKQTFFKGITFATLGPGGESNRQIGAPEWMVKATKFPKFKPPYHGLLIDGEGHYWIRTYPSAPKAPAAFDAFDPKGRFLGRVEILEGLIPYYTIMRDGGFWGVRTDKDGEYSVVYFKITG